MVTRYRSSTNTTNGCTVVVTVVLSVVVLRSVGVTTVEDDVVEVEVVNMSVKICW